MSIETASIEASREVPQIVMNGDTARARRGDKITSHIAADASRAHLHETKQHVLELVAVHGSLVGSEINATYRRIAEERDWRLVAFDTPRKRAGELATEHLLDDSETRTAEGNHLPETIYRITQAGLDALGAVTTDLEPWLLTDTSDGEENRFPTYGATLEAQSVPWETITFEPRSADVLAKAARS